jgi:hypothetical protein
MIEVGEIRQVVFRLGVKVSKRYLKNMFHIDLEVSECLFWKILPNFHRPNGPQFRDTVTTKDFFRTLIF